jgi:hypothetical protein
MGHLTALAPSVEAAERRVLEAREALAATARPRARAEGER